ncbi:MAG: AI-2E family transporter [Armatimonadetes bacterium]|nr:AI-2E family transporter [Armatimonadota bacterium]
MAEPQPTPPERSYWTPSRIAVAAAIVAVAAWLVFRGSSIAAYALARLGHVLVTLILATALAYIVWPAVVATERLVPFFSPRVRRTVAALVVILAFVAALGLLGVVTIAPILAELKGLGSMMQQLLLQLPDQIEELGRAYGRYLPQELVEGARQKVVDWATAFFAAQASVFKGLVLRGWALVELVIVPVLAFYFVADGAALAEQFIAQLPERRRERVRAMGAEMNALLHSYVRAQVVLCFLMAVLTSVILLVAGVRVYLTLGLLAGVAWAVPILGPIVAGVPIVAVCLMQRGLHVTLAVLGAYVGLNFLQTKVIMPRVLAGSARLHPVLIIVSLLIGAEFLGVLGMFIAVPTAAVFRVLFRHLRALSLRGADEA